MSISIILLVLLLDKETQLLRQNMTLNIIVSKNYIRYIKDLF
jgi:hypothetical protein